MQRSAAMLLVLTGALALAPTAHATWSIVVTDSRTGEVAIGSATCVEDFDLLAASPVLVVGAGGGVAQSVVDSSGANRLAIRDGLVARTDPDALIESLSDDPFFQSRQYGIADTLARAAAFTGRQAGEHASGRTGTQGTLAYAIQGNLLTGEPVITAAEQALLAGGVDVPARLMRAMLAAAAKGGDGRCSCSPGNPDGCGAPPPDFEKSAHIGYMLDARLGDTDGGCDPVGGCAAGDYHMRFNVAFQQDDDPDPVLQLRQRFLDWRSGLAGRPDHYRSSALLDDESLPADGASTTLARIVLRDWRGRIVTAEIESVEVTLDPTSTAAPAISPVFRVAQGVYVVQLMAPTSPGVARLRVEADDGVRPVLLAPLPELEIL
jgi:hypothetical protein